MDHHRRRPPPLNLVDLGRIWHVASSGLSLHENLHREMPRVTSLCVHTILQKELYQISSMTRDFEILPCAETQIYWDSTVVEQEPEIPVVEMFLKGEVRGGALIGNLR